jgi:hypothetical protein
VIFFYEPQITIPLNSIVAVGLHAGRDELREKSCGRDMVQTNSG